ncbi:MAG: sigma-70 family RNA polymerase sigma factor [Acidobacteria bacterium]|nr:sigma-70 family RNA polymerase sigma factor [Acidobacteriota bacterium]
MAKLPVLKPREVLQALFRAGFYIHHQTGSHARLFHRTRSDPRVTVPIHSKDRPFWQYPLPISQMLGERLTTDPMTGRRELSGRPAAAAAVVGRYNRSSMPSEPAADVTQLLLAWSDGNEEALNKLTPLVYAELRRIARRFMAKERPSHTLEATALVNEVYMKLVDASRVRWQNRVQFFGVAAQLMRRILVDYARNRRARKRGGAIQRVTLQEAQLVAAEPELDLAALDEALQELARLDPRKAKVVELRFFGGLSQQETAEVLRVSTDTVWRDWRAAKAWLLRELRQVH